MAIELSPIDAPAPTLISETIDTMAETTEAAEPAKRGRGRPAGSPNKPKEELPKKKRVASPAEPVEPPPEPAAASEEPPPSVEEPAVEEPVVEEPPPAVEEPEQTIPAPKKKKRTVRVAEAFPPLPLVPPIPIVPERPRPEDLLRQMHLDARQRMGDSFTARRDAWTNQLNAKYK
jgi:hypothetical protein